MFGESETAKWQKVLGVEEIKFLDCFEVKCVEILKLDLHIELWDMMKVFKSWNKTRNK